MIMKQPGGRGSGWAGQRVGGAAGGRGSGWAGQRVGGAAGGRGRERLGEDVGLADQAGGGVDDQGEHDGGVLADQFHGD
jgi:hypothetical protein